MHKNISKLISNVKSNKSWIEQLNSIISWRMLKNSKNITSRFSSSFMLKILISAVEDFIVIFKASDRHKRQLSSLYRYFTFDSLFSKTRTHVSHIAWSQIKIFSDLRRKHHIQVRLLKILLYEIFSLLTISLWMHLTFFVNSCISTNISIT